MKNRIAMLGIPPMLMEILARGIAQHSDMELLGGLPAASAAEEVGRLDADVLVVGPRFTSSGSDPVELLELNPRLKIFLLEDEDRKISLLELAPERTLLGELSPHELVAAIRKAVGHRPEVH